MIIGCAGWGLDRLRSRRWREGDLMALSPDGRAIHPTIGREAAVGGHTRQTMIRRRSGPVDLVLFAISLSTPWR